MLHLIRQTTVLGMQITYRVQAINEAAQTMLARIDGWALRRQH